MIKKYPKYLPLGSVILLNESNNRLMIIGYQMFTDKEKDKVYDYIGCLYPQGVIRTDYNILFNHDQIEKIYALGFTDFQSRSYMDVLNKSFEVTLPNEKSLDNVE